MTAYFSVTNYDQQQHYKDRGPTWIKLYNRLLDDYGFAKSTKTIKSKLAKRIRQSVISMNY
jgi:hypothetical protein